MNIVFMGAKQGGMIGLLIVLAYFGEIRDQIEVVAYDDNIKKIIQLYGRCMGYLENENYYETSINNINLERLNKYNDSFDLLVSVHGREIVSNEILSKFKYGGINLHPMLSKYKGANPITRFMNDSFRGKTDNMASVGVHRMTDVLDSGEVLSEKFIEIDSPWEKSPAEIYNELYPLYPLVLMEAIQKACG